ncbi:unnamed protein product [Pylaiella littoralis]
MTDAAAATTAPAAEVAAAAVAVPASTEEALGQEDAAAVGCGSGRIDDCKELGNGSSGSNNRGTDGACVAPKTQGDRNGGNRGTGSLESGGGYGSATDDAADAGQAKQKRPPRVGSVRQGRKDKRKAAWEAKKAMLKEKKREEREKREEAMRKEGREIPADGKDYRDLPQEQWSVSQRIRHAKRQEFEALSTEGGYRICIDMAFDELMLAKAQASLVQQVLYAYGANRKAAQPCRMTLSGMGAVMDTKVRKLQGFDEWLGVTTDSRCYTEIFDKGELVYLTADSPDIITHLEEGKVYVLGGLVDRNSHKGLCFNKATGQGIATAKLPLNKEDLHGNHSKVLATNHVFDILLRAMGAGGEIGKVEEKALPPRKRAGWVGGDDRGPSSMPVARQSDLQSPDTQGQTPPNANRNGLEEVEGDTAAEAAGEANRNKSEQGEGGVAVVEANRSNSEEERGAATGMESSSATKCLAFSDAPVALKEFIQENSEATEPDRSSPAEGARKELRGKGDEGEGRVKSESQQEGVKADGKSEGGGDEVAGGKREVEKDGGARPSPGADAKRIKTVTGGVA